MRTRSRTWQRPSPGRRWFNPALVVPHAVALGSRLDKSLLLIKGFWTRERISEEFLIPTAKSSIYTSPSPIMRCCRPQKVTGSTPVTVSMLNLQTENDSGSFAVADDLIPSEVLEGLKRWKVQISYTPRCVFPSARLDFYSLWSRRRRIKQNK